MSRAAGLASRHRITHPFQQGARLAWSDSLFQQVERVPDEPLPPPIPVGEATESDFGEFYACELRAALRGEGA